MEREPIEMSGGEENVSRRVEAGRNYLDGKGTELAGVENVVIPPGVLAQAQEILLAIRG